jgi:hypothetical protein
MSMREQDEKPEDEARSHSVGFLKKAERIAKKKGKRGKKRGGKGRKTAKR